MEYIIFFIVVIINSIFITIKLKNRIEINIPISIMSMIIIVYVFGLFNKLVYGVLLLAIISGINFIYDIYYLIKYRKEIEIKKVFITPGIVIYILLGIIFIIFNKGIVFREYDEFSHWGLIVKNMFEFGNFGTDNTIIQYSEYPPFIPIFQYILLMIKNVYSEDTIIIGLNLLYISFCIPLFKNIKWDKSLIKTIIIIPIILLIPVLFYMDFYTTLFIDGLLGVLFAYTICSWFMQKGKERYIATVLGLIALILTKSVGIVFALCVALIILISEIFSKNENRKKDIINIIILTLLTLSVYATWQIKIKVDNAQEKWNVSEVNITNIVKVIKGEGEYYQKTTIKKFIDEVFLNDGSITFLNMNVIKLLIFFIAIDIGIYILLRNNERRKQLIIISISLLLFWIIYIISILLIYLFIFTPEEAMILACFSRYVSTIPLAMILIDIAFLIENYKKSKWKIKYILLTLCVLLTCVPTYEFNRNYIQNNKNKQERLYYRVQYQGISKYNNSMSLKDKVYYISNFVDEREIIIVKYEFLPFKIANENPKLTITKEEFVEKLKTENYTHVYIRKSDRILEGEFKDLFINGEIKDNTMYQIIQNEDGKILFQEMK